ncbi:GntR family transcriptional regulator [Nocardioides acrostichi]|uniref:GntR family transcriptional regulator n=1 Tax=Nocardioides acrostichi TaxID=2784339 RepID=A0A930Y9U4_9ACTN|nr:GntR family transcriptional regulator [Nocardioides acrostichi]MBF4160733.1 GntR family transcriptional regulator [Nocardioides acrostichi]
MVVIRQAMVDGDIRPGEVFSASALAQQLGVSNSPVRDACMELVHSGILEVVRNRGFRLVYLDQEALDNVYEIRIMLEGPAVERIADRDLTEHEPPLREFVERCLAAALEVDTQGFLQYDRLFHLTLLGLLDNPKLVDIVDGLRDQTRIAGMHRLVETGGLERSAREHGELLDALVAGEAERSRDIMVRHLAHGSSRRPDPVDSSRSTH